MAESWKFNIQILATIPNKRSTDFSNFFPYVEKIDFESGPR